MGSFILLQGFILKIDGFVFILANSQFFGRQQYHPQFIPVYQVQKKSAAIQHGQKITATDHRVYDQNSDYHHICKRLQGAGDARHRPESFTSV